MNEKKNILVFPCGSEIALEIHRSLENSIHFNLIGGNSVEDHGKFVFENYIGGIPNSSHKNFIKSIKRIVVEHNIDLIYPAMDNVINILKSSENEIGCPIVSSDTATTQICLSKSKTYSILKEYILTPIIYEGFDQIKQFPVFLKPDVGYGSRGVFKINNFKELKSHFKKDSNLLILEFLPGKEYTVDCFTNFNGELLFVGARGRNRISNGISVNTSTMPLENRFENIAKEINQKIAFNGAWFFQVKERADGALVLMEVASRFGGSSSVYRAIGINFAALSVFNLLGIKVSLIKNNYKVELDRSLDAVYKIDLEFNHVYVDFDDTLIFQNKVNYNLVALIYKFLNKGKKIYLITKHEYRVEESLLKFRLIGLFDEIIHLKRLDQKWKFIKHEDSIFIDDSFAERKEVKDNLGLPVFSIDMINML
jgi:hypothetical protein